MKCALFVDFDNIYSSLHHLDNAAADRFAKAPADWVNWMISSLALPEHVTTDAKRRVLVRRCYLNPQAHQRFRPYFNLAGFETIDCPPLTAGGKTSTDIHMVLDIVDLLRHEVQYDEFIVLSADADFTPVLRKLRRWDRRTTVLAIGFPSAAYRASADLIIDQTEFIRDALGISKSGENNSSKTYTDQVAKLVADLVRHLVEKADRALPLASLASQVRAKIDGIDDSWLGHGSFSMLLRASGLNPLQLSAWNGGVIYDPQRHDIFDKPSCAEAPEKCSNYINIANLIREEVIRAVEPVACARLATLITNRTGVAPGNWYGSGSFRRFLESLDLRPLKLNWTVAGGIAYDPSRHKPTLHSNVVNSLAWSDRTPIFALASRLNEVAGVPLLAPEQYHALFNFLANDFLKNGYQALDTGKRVRNCCREAGLSVNRADVDFVLRVIANRNYLPEAHDNTAEELAEEFIDHINFICRKEQIILDQTAEDLICSWIKPSGN